MILNRNVVKINIIKLFCSSPAGNYCFLYSKYSKYILWGLTESPQTNWICEDFVCKYSMLFRKFVYFVEGVNSRMCFSGSMNHCFSYLLILYGFIPFE